ncbi:uncharacterized protein TNCV_2749991 [Trichonephila clavipes]|nr:uncharacterized protein TNCV_2749991 [Trichonephila clavipes]
MFLREYDAKEQNTSVDQEKSYIDKMPSSCNTEQAIIFPYIGPPGTGPGLLGSKPGSDKLEYLTALEHWPIYDRKVKGMLFQPASSQPGLVGGTVVLLENSFTLRITEQV